jgi:hypothetical protein
MVFVLREPIIMSDKSTFCITISVPSGTDQYFRSRQELGRQIGDCVFEQTSCVERGLRIEYVFSGYRTTSGKGPREMKPTKAKRPSLAAMLRPAQ